MALAIRYERSFDSFNRNENRIYRVGLALRAQGKVLGSSPEFVAALGPAMLKDMPEVENYVRIATPRTLYFTYGDHSFKVRDATYADSSLFDIFSFKLIAGVRNRALTDPYSVVLTRTTASRIFGNQDPVGKTLIIGDSRTGYRDWSMISFQFRYSVQRGNLILYTVQQAERFPGLERRRTVCNVRTA